jgi:hypothetical protein
MLRRLLDLPWARAFLAVFLLFSSAFLLHRLGMLRPQVLSLGSCLLVRALAVGNIWGIFCTLASTWLHLNFLRLFLDSRRFASSKFSMKKNHVAGSAGFGRRGFTSWLLRPNPVGAAKFYTCSYFN